MHWEFGVCEPALSLLCLKPQDNPNALKCFFPNLGRSSPQFYQIKIRIRSCMCMCMPNIMKAWRKGIVFSKKWEDGFQLQHDPPHSLSLWDSPSLCTCSHFQEEPATYDITWTHHIKLVLINRSDIAENLVIFIWSWQHGNLYSTQRNQRACYANTGHWFDKSPGNRINICILCKDVIYFNILKR